MSKPLFCVYGCADGDMGPCEDQPCVMVWPLRRAANCPRPQRNRQVRRPAFRNPSPSMGTIKRWEGRLLRGMDRMTDAKIHAELNDPEALALADAVTDEQLARMREAFYAAGGGAYVRQS